MGRAPKVHGLPDRLGREPYRTIFEVAVHRHFVAELVAMSKDPDAPSPKLASLGLPSDHQPSFPPKLVKEELKEKGENVPSGLHNAHRTLVEEGVLQDAGHGLYRLDPAVFESLLWDNTLHRLRQAPTSAVATYPIEATKPDGSSADEPRLKTPEGTTVEGATSDVPSITGAAGMTAAAHVVVHDDFGRGGPDVVEDLRGDEQLQSLLLKVRQRIGEHVEAYGSGPIRMEVVLPLWGSHLRFLWGRDPDDDALGEAIPLDGVASGEEE